MVRRFPLLVLLMSLLLAACITSSVARPQKVTSVSLLSSPATAPTPTDIPSAPAHTIQPQATTEPTHLPSGGKLIALAHDPPTLDPHRATDTVSGRVIVEIYGGLVGISPDLKIIPDLAESWEVSPNGRTYTFHLRPDAKFHNGKPVTVEDLRWSLERVTDHLTRSPVAAQYLSDILGVDAKLSGATETIRGIEVGDRHTLGLTIDAPKAYFLAKLTYPIAFVLDQEALRSDPEDWSQHPNGTGPFKLAEYLPGRTLTLARNANYHLEPAHVDEVELVLAGGNGLLMYENDEIHLTTVELGDLARVNDPNSSLNPDLHRWAPDFGVSYIGLNANKPPLDDRNVRLALNLAIERTNLASNVLQDLVVPSQGIIPPGFPSYNPDLTGYAYDPARARQLLRESKYGHDLENLPPITLSVPEVFGGVVGLDIQLILQAWEELGVSVEIEQAPWATFLDDLRRRRFQSFQSGWVADYPDPENFLDVLFHSASDNNHLNYANPKVDALLEQARVEPDQTSRFRTYNRVEQMILDDTPWVPLWNSGTRYTLIKPNVKGYQLTPLLLPKLRFVYFLE